MVTKSLDFMENKFVLQSKTPLEKILYFFKINQCFSVNTFENSTKKNEYFWKISCVSKQYPFEKKQCLFENKSMFHCKAL